MAWAGALRSRARERAREAFSSRAGMPRVARRFAREVVSRSEWDYAICARAFVAVDLADGEAAATKIMDAAVAAFGTVDLLVNSAAACFPRGDLETTTPELWDTMMDTNVKAPFLLTQAFARHLKQREGARRRRQYWFLRGPRRRAFHLGVFVLQGGSRVLHEKYRRGATAARHTGQPGEHGLVLHRGRRSGPAPDERELVGGSRRGVAVRGAFCGPRTRPPPSFICSARRAPW